ncbi:MAG: acyltransferase, partial [Patescibacteria group bacterium]
EGVHIGDGVFIGHGVMFTNDRHPGAVNEDGSVKGKGDWVCEETHIEDGVALGSNVTILPGIRIGKGAMVGAGAVVTKDVAAGSIVAGNPAKPMGNPAI